MNLKKSFLALFSTALLFVAMAPAAFASTGDKTSAYAPSEGDPTSISSQLLELLEEIDISKLTEERKVFVDFMINAKGEILVLSTNDEDFDAAIKSRLNYKKLSNHFLQIDKTYTIPVLFRK